MWIPIIGYEGLYSIDENGTVINSKGEIIQPYISNKGYKIVSLYKNNVGKKFLVHRLVAIHFVPNPNKYPIVLHLDNVKLNTHYSNLKWGTYSDNQVQAIRDGLNTVPITDNREIYEVYNGDDVNICYGLEQVKTLTNYPYKFTSLSNYVHRRVPLKSGPYTGYYIREANYPPAIIFNR